MIGCVEFVTRDGKIKLGYLVRSYRAFEGDMRYILCCEEDNKVYRCIKNADGKFVEFSV